jgi:hypothetical protein
MSSWRAVVATPSSPVAFGSCATRSSAVLRVPEPVLMDPVKVWLQQGEVFRVAEDVLARPRAEVRIGDDQCSHGPIQTDRAPPGGVTPLRAAARRLPRRSTQP